MNWSNIKYNKIDKNPYIDENKGKELLMHTIHAYPAKFPAFIANGAFNYAKAEGVEIKRVVDIFCGCGTTALESKINSYDYWGCDINPVATLIARVKSCLSLFYSSGNR